jgi:CTP:molybdopterin cytidylyltransferase MocA
MGSDKQLLDVDGQALLSRVISAVRAAVDSLTVVTRRTIADSLGLETLDCTLCFNEDPVATMIDSVRMGVSAACASGPVAVMILPGDLPGLDAESTSRCVAAFHDDPRRIVIGAHGGRRGHPILIPPDLIQAIHGPLCHEGLNAIPKHYADRVTLVELSSHQALLDLDTPEDYERLATNPAADRRRSESNSHIERDVR